MGVISGIMEAWGIGSPARHISRSAPLFDAFGRLRVSNADSLFDSKLSFGKLPLYWDEVTSANTAYRWCLLLNPTITGTPNWVAGANSPIQAWLNAGTNITMTGGTQLASGYSSRDNRQSNDQVNPSIQPGMSIAGTPDVVALGIESIGGTSSCSGGIAVRQLV